LPSSYYAKYELKTNEIANDWTDLVHLIDVINNTPSQNFRDSLERVLDTQTFIDVWASTILFSNLDSYQGSGHNYYLYHDTTENRFKFISWDVNEAFGNFQMGQGWPGIQTLTPFFIPNPPNSRPLTNKMLQNTTYHDAYLDRLCEFATYDFTTAHLYPIVDSLANLIRADVYADPNKMYTNQQFETNLTQPISSGPMGQIPRLKDFIIGRRNALQTQLAGFGCTMVVGMEGERGANDGRVYPNPTSGRMFVDLLDHEGFFITICNAQGQIIAVQRIDSPHQPIDLDLAKGMYFYRIADRNGVIRSGKISLE
jgi:hypothetical protein